MICFDAEDPKKYVKRIRYAIERRRKCDILTRYNLIVDCMSLKEAGEFDKSVQTRIEQNVHSVKCFAKVNLSHLIMEANQDYGRCMNKIIFDHYLKETDKEDKEKEQILKEVEP